MAAQELDVSGTQWKGTIVFRSGKIFNLEKQGVSSLSVETTDYQESPDKKWVIYQRITSDENGHWKSLSPSLIGNNKISSAISSWPLKWQWIIGWLDNDRVALVIPERPKGAITLFNVVTGERQEILPAFSDFELKAPGYNPQNFAPFIFYSPDLRWVVYSHSNPGDFPDLRLRDLSSNQIIGSETSVSEPKWSPDRTMVAIGIFSLGKGSKLQIWAHEAQGLKEITFPAIPDSLWVYDFSWSPNSQWIAVWYGSGESDKNDKKLMLINVMTSEVINLCLSSRYPSMPVWSPDGQYILQRNIENYIDSKQALYIIDIKNNLASQIKLLGIDILKDEPVAWIVDS